MRTTKLRNNLATLLLSLIASSGFAQTALGKLDESSWRSCYVRGSPDGDYFPVALGEQQKYLVQLPPALNGQSIIYMYERETATAYIFRSGPVYVEFSKDMKIIVFNFSTENQNYRGVCKK